MPSKAKKRLSNEFSMCLQWYDELDQLDLASRLPESDAPGQDWRKPAVMSLYFNLRADGINHKEAIKDVLAALPNLKLDQNWNVVWVDTNKNDGSQ